MNASRKPVLSHMLQYSAPAHGPMFKRPNAPRDFILWLAFMALVLAIGCMAGGVL